MPSSPSKGHLGESSSTLTEATLSTTTATRNSISPPLSQHKTGLAALPSLSSSTLLSVSTASAAAAAATSYLASTMHSSPAGRGGGVASSSAASSSSFLTPRVAEDSKVTVAIRVRPPTAEEAKQERSLTQGIVVNGSQIQVNGKDGSSKNTFTFDQCFDKASGTGSQEHIFDSVGRKVLAHAWEGMYCVCVCLFCRWLSVFLFAWWRNIAIIYTHIQPPHTYTHTYTQHRLQHVRVRLRPDGLGEDTHHDGERSRGGGRVGAPHLPAADQVD